MSSCNIDSGCDSTPKSHRTRCVNNRWLIDFLTSATQNSGRETGFLRQCGGSCRIAKRGSKAFPLANPAHLRYLHTSIPIYTPAFPLFAVSFSSEEVV